MRFSLVLPVLFLPLHLAIAAGDISSKPPVTAQKPVTDVVQGISIVDNYRWLEDQNSPETRAWIAEQQAYTNSYFASLSEREETRQRLSELMRVDEYNPPHVRNHREFFLRQPGDKNQNQLCLRDETTGKEEVLVDANLLSTSQPITVRILDISKDGNLLIYGLQEGGQDELTPHFLNVDTRQELRESLPKGNYFSVSLLPDKTALFYSKKLPNGASRLFFHKMGSDAATDKLIFGEGYGTQTFINGDVTHDGRWLIATATTGWGVKSDVYAMRLGHDEKPKPIITGLDGEFDPGYYDDHLYVVTTWKAPNRRLFSLDLNHPEQAAWRDVLHEQKDHLQNAQIIGGKLAVVYLHNVVSQVAIFNLNGKLERTISLPTLGSAGIAGEPDQDEMFWYFVSFAFPPVIYRYNVLNGTQSVWWKSTVQGRFDDFDVKQVWFESRDKTSIPMFIVSRKGLAQDGTARALMTGYGGFDASLTPVFSELAAYWVEQGGVFALPNIRGGGEFGEAWHRAGMFEKKQNVFDDFEAAAEYLENNHYTSASRLGIMGGSNGGLLVGAAVTQRPDLFGAVVCSYPLLDMIRFDQFKVAKWWVPEYGSAQNKDQFGYLFKYSPYHHVEKGVKYPAVLFVTGDNDTRVDPLHARKMTALMQASTGSSRPVLLKYDTTSGHSGGKPLDVRINDTADMALFLKNELK